MKKIRMAIQGCGEMSGVHARRYRANPVVEIVGLCDVKSSIVESFIEKHLSQTTPRPAIFTDVAQMYAETKPDAVTIVIPHTLHFEYGMRALEAGCHIFMEKPMVTDLEQAKQLRDAAAQAGKILVIGYNVTCTPAFRWLREAIRIQELGRLETISGWLCQSWNQQFKGTWRQNPALSGGGMMYDSGAHILNSLVWTVESEPQTVFALIDDLDTPVDINGAINLRFKNGVLATLTIDGNTTARGAGMSYIFDGGRVEIDAWAGSWIKVWRDREEIEPELGSEVGTPNDNFIEALLGRSEPLTGPVNGVVQSALMDAIYQSARTGQAVEAAL